MSLRLRGILLMCHQLSASVTVLAVTSRELPVMQPHFIQHDLQMLLATLRRQK